MEKEKKIIPASVQIPAVNGGWLDHELGEAMSNAVKAVLEHGKQAEIAVKLKIQPQNLRDGTIKISHDVSAKLPKERREGGIVYATPDGNIQANDPKQGNLKLKSVDKADTGLKFINKSEAAAVAVVN